MDNKYYLIEMQYFVTSAITVKSLKMIEYFLQTLSYEL